MNRLFNQLRAFITHVVTSIRLSLVADLYRSILESFIRFWDNRFREDSEIEFLRLQIEKERAETRRVLATLLETVSPKPLVGDEPVREYKPLGQPNWKVRARELEAKSRQERLEMDKQNSNSSKSIDELEQELGVGNV